MPRRYSRFSRPPGKYEAHIALFSRMGNEDNSVPFTYDETVSGLEDEEWKVSMCEEIKEIGKQKTWKFLPRLE